MPNRIDIVRLVWTLSFGIGALNHARDIWDFGWLPYTSAPMLVNLYWTLLLPLDSLAALLIWSKPRAGAYLGLAIMISDVVINCWMVFGSDYGPMGYALIMQTAFLLFVLATFAYVAKIPAISRVKQDKA